MASLATPGFLVMPVLVGSATIVGAAALYHRLATGHAYPAGS
jgi:CBS-domain-containing membrane protein